MDGLNYPLIAIFLFVLITIFKGVRVVPQQNAWIIERLGKFRKVLDPGLHLIVPYINKVVDKHSLKERAIDVDSQFAITKDNVSLEIDGIIYVRIVDPKQASYGVERPYFALTELAQTTMRSEIGKIELDKTFKERENLNANIVSALNDASTTWGIQCMRYEIKNINPPRSILDSMEQQVTAERTKRAQVLESEGKRQYQINIAEAGKQEKVLSSEAAKIDQINRAEGEAKAITTVAVATADSIGMVAKAIEEKGGSDAVALNIAEKYIEAFSQLAKESNTIILPAQTNDVGSFVAQALAVFDKIRNNSDQSLGDTKS